MCGQTYKLLRTQVAIFGISLTCFAALAQEVLIDQQDVTFYPYTLPVGSSGYIAQEFTPSLNSLDFVDLFITAEPLHGPLPAGAFSVAIKERTISGLSLGVSQTAIVGPVSPSAPTRLHFSNSVPLVPGKTYVFQLLHDGSSSNGYWSLYYDPYSTYSGGEAILGGSPGGADLWFREGVTHPPLGIVRISAAQARLVWPTNFTDYSLQSSATLPAASWITVTNMVSMSNGHFSVMVDVEAARRFFRLSKPSG